MEAILIEKRAKLGPKFFLCLQLLCLQLLAHSKEFVQSRVGPALGEQRSFLGGDIVESRGKPMPIWLK